MQVELTRIFHFEAAHRLPNLPPEHKCHRLHGHGYEVEVAVAGAVDPSKGWYVDYNDIKRVVRPLVERLDHNYLNEIEGLDNPTSENVAAWLWERVVPALPGLAWIRVSETRRSGCVFRGPGAPVRLMERGQDDPEGQDA